MDNPSSNDSNDAPINVVDTDEENADDDNSVREQVQDPKLLDGLNNVTNTLCTNSAKDNTPLPAINVTDSSLSSRQSMVTSKDSNHLTIQPFLKKRPSNFGSEETELSPTTSVTSLCSNQSCSSTFTTNGDADRKRRLSQASSSDAGCYISATNKKGM